MNPFLLQNRLQPFIQLLISETDLTGAQYRMKTSEYLNSNSIESAETDLHLKATCQEREASESEDFLKCQGE